MRKRLTALTGFAFFLLLGSMAFANEPKGTIRIIIEAENMHGVNHSKFGPGKGWQVGRWGKDLYQNMTFGGVWASRLRTAMTDKGDNHAEIYSDIEVPKTGTYKLWVKYESPPFFNYAFGVKVEQLNKKVVFDKIYGLLISPKQFSFKKTLTRGSLYWPWGIDHDAAEGYRVNLKKGKYRLIIYKTKNPEPAAPRSIDVIMLTSNLSKISSPRYPRYPLLDELRRANHVYFRFRNKSSQAIKITWNRWAHRYPDFYSPLPFPVKYYDARGKFLGTMGSRSLQKSLGPIRAGEISPWYDFGPGMDVSSTSAFIFRSFGTKPENKLKRFPFEVDIALNPDERKILKSFELGKGEKELSILVQPDLSTKEGLKYTKKIVDIYKDIIKQLNAEKRIGPIPRKLKLFASTAGATPTNDKVTWDFNVRQEFRYALGLNTLPVNSLNKKYIAAVINWRKKKKGGFIKKSLIYEHSQDIEKIIKLVKAKNLEDYFYALSYGDEISLPGINPKDKKTVAEFQNYVRNKGETLKSLGLASWKQVKPLCSISPSAAMKVGVLPEKETGNYHENIKKLKKLYWYTLRFQEKKGIETFAQKTKEIKKSLGESVQTTANFSPGPFYWMNQTSFIESFKHQTMSLAWAEDFTYPMPEASALIEDFEASYLRKGASYHNTPMMFYDMPHYPGNNPKLLLQNTVLLWANNVKDLDFFWAGPDGFFTENYIAYRGGLPMFKMVREISGMAGLIEDDLLPARPVPTPVAMLLSPASDLWETAGKGQGQIKPGSVATNVFQEERKNIWYALRMTGYRVDFVTENDLNEGLLHKYKVLYVVGQNMERETAKNLKKWIEKGGIVFATAGAARKDEFDQPFSFLDETFGRGKQKAYQKYRGPLRAKLELLFQNPIDRIIFNDSSMKVLCVKETFEPSPGTEILARYTSDGQPALVKKETGKGTVYYSGFLPGMAFVQQGLKVLPMGKGGGTQSFCNSGAGHFELVDSDDLAQQIILLPLTENDISPDVEVQHRGVITGRLKGPHSTVIPIVNLAEETGGKLKNLKVIVRDLGDSPRKVWSAFYPEGLKFKKEKNTIIITLPVLETADVMVIRK